MDTCELHLSNGDVEITEDKGLGQSNTESSEHHDRSLPCRGTVYIPQIWIRALVGFCL